MLWDRLVQDSEGRAWSVLEGPSEPDDDARLAESHELAVSMGEEHFKALMWSHEEGQHQRRRGLEEAFRLRAAAAGQIAIDNIRTGRLRALEQERKSALLGVTDRVPVPLLEPLLVLKVRGG